MTHRLHYFDVLRIFLIISVFWHHAIVTFIPFGSWYYRSPEYLPDWLQTILIGLLSFDHSYCIGLFFFISAFLSHGSFEHKGVKTFVRNRLNRLGIPLLIYSFVLHPLLVYWINGVWHGFESGQLWFVEALLIFDLLYVAIRTWHSKHPIVRPPSLSLSTPVAIFLFIAVVGGLSFLIRLRVSTDSKVLWLPLGDFALYIAMYIMGIAARQYNWLERLRQRQIWVCVAFILLVGLPSLLYLGAHFTTAQIGLVVGGYNPFALFFAYWQAVMCVAFSWMLLTIFKTCYNKAYSLIKVLSPISYSAYIIHPFLIVGCTFVAEQLPLSPVWRFGFVCLTAIPGSFLVAPLFRRMLSLVGVRV